jgi:DNA-binding beta-propeller fold protein YncE
VAVHHSISPAIQNPATIGNIVPTIPLLNTTPPPPSYANLALEFGSEGIGAGQFKDSRSVAVDGDGHIYVGEYSDGRVQVFDASGKFLSAWSIGKKLSLMNLLADRHGSVYAVTPGNITKFDGATGLQQMQLDNTFNDNSLDYMDACLTLNGDVYALAGSADIVDIGSDGHIKSDVNESQKVGDDVDFFRIAISGTGEFYALDRQKGVFKFASDGRYINRFGGNGDDPATPPRPGHLISPNGIAVDGQGRIFVTDDGPPVQVFDAEGSFVNSFGGTDLAFGICINDKNEIFACFRNLHTVRKYTLAGQ